MTISNTFDVRPGAPISIWIEATRYSATMLEISGEHALVEVPSDILVKKHGVVALLLREFVSLPMRVENQNGGLLSLSFLNPPHPSVLFLAIGKILDESIAEAMAVEERVDTFRNAA